MVFAAHKTWWWYEGQRWLVNLGAQKKKVAINVNVFPIFHELISLEWLDGEWQKNSDNDMVKHFWCDFSTRTSLDSTQNYERDFAPRWHTMLQWQQNWFHDLSGECAQGGGKHTDWVTDNEKQPQSNLAAVITIT